jgi:hypothetical protein
VIPSTIAIPNYQNFNIFPPALTSLVNIFRSLFAGMLAAMLYTFFAVFPERSPIDRRAPTFPGRELPALC